ncbi:MAG: peptidase [Candidatus Angelobacter sp.]|nr:peptidase [Candidatus Angelobacter sp.]
MPDPAIVAALKDVSAAQIQATIEKLVSFGNRSTLSAADPESVAAGRGIGAAREWIKSEFERYSNACGGCLDVRTDDFIEPPSRRIAKPTQLVNVYAVLKGTDPEAAKRIYLVTGHYDSRNSDNFNATDPAPGANDDGSGTAVSLECARVLSRHKFPATIIFLTVPGEEQGLYGSKHFAQMAKAQGWKIEAALNNDIVGGNKSPEQDTGVVRVFSEGIPAAATEAEIKLIRSIGAESDSPSRQVARYISDTGKKYGASLGSFGPMMIFRPDRYLRGGDHTSFNEAGFAAIRFTEFREDFTRQHQTPRTENGIEFGDFAKFVDFEYVANVARLNAATLASLATAPAPPANLKLLTKQLENNSQLVWDAPANGSTASYEVLWRATTSPDWEHSHYVGNATKATMDMSKDNVIFAVRSVDDKGHASLPVTPTPER